MAENKKRIPASVLEQARKVLAKVPVKAAGPAESKASAPQSRGAKAREKIVGALRKLHPMD
jgi:hypothetical protein